ncbi:cytochrome b5-like heme/steroid binding domain-containing protein [Arachnia propionica]|uniref:Cytochrome b5 domain-containing protein n=1 Tax=Arachnia propionica TaxID=1750 RepID=A0A3P1WUH6_9ACTN|nr:cytochrome b5-like heme/steroid binding domain-containing protein [Arachnia propionica]RRD50219.1 cytochrome b5 domain-containing protein [Arachnia propionica]
MILNLPLHPLFVHLPVVLIPLATLGVTALMLLRNRSRQLAIATLGVTTVAALSTIASLISGNALAELKGFNPETHGRWGLFLMIAAIAFLLAAGPWLWRISREGDAPSPTTRPLGMAASLLGLVATVFTFLAGHSGATLAWSDVAAAPTTTTSPAAAPSTSASPEASTSPSTEAGKYTAEEVAKHNTESDCWAIVDGNAYDLTEWIGSHPGGPGAITKMCGTDATQAFQGKHGGAEGPTKALERFLLGPVS